MPKAYQGFSPERCTPLMAVDGVPVVAPFSPYHKIFLVADDHTGVKRTIDLSVFWDEIVADFAAAWNAQPVRSSNVLLNADKTDEPTEIY